MKKNLVPKLLVFIALSALLQSCGTTKAQRSVEEKLAAEPPISDQATLADKEQQTIESATNLTEDQKAQLNALRQSAREKSAQIEEQSLKLRDILVKDLVAANYDSKKSNEVRTIKSKIVKLNRERTNLTLDSIEKAQKILGRQAKDNQMMMNNFLQRDFDNRGAY